MERNISYSKQQMIDMDQIILYMGNYLRDSVKSKNIYWWKKYINYKYKDSIVETVVSQWNEGAGVSAKILWFLL